jgi:cell division septum initiation protein DivIVA
VPDFRDFRERAELLGDTLITAQKAANDVRQEARRSASDVLRSARRRAEHIVGEAEKERERLAEEIRRLELHAETSRISVSEFLRSLLDQVQLDPDRERDSADADLAEVIFDHEISKVAESPGVDTDSLGSVPPTKRKPR